MGSDEGRKDDEGKLDWTLLPAAGAQLFGRSESFESMVHSAVVRGDYGVAAALIMARASLPGSEATNEVVRVLAFGAKKYERDGWKKVADSVRRYRAACMRHVVAMRDCAFDPESGLMHSAHALCNLMFLHCLDGGGQGNE